MQRKHFVGLLLDSCNDEDPFVLFEILSVFSYDIKWMMYNMVNNGGLITELKLSADL